VSVPEIVLLPTVADPVPEIEQLGNTPTLPDGTVSVRTSCAPVRLPTSVPVIVMEPSVRSLVDENVIGPETLLPVWVITQRAVHALVEPNGTPLIVLGNWPNVPDHVPDRLSEGAVGEEPPQATPVIASVTASMGLNQASQVIVCFRFAFDNCAV